MLSVLWWVRLSVNVPVGPMAGVGGWRGMCQGSAQGTVSGGDHFHSPPWPFPGELGAERTS